MKWAWNNDAQSYESDCGRFEISPDGKLWQLCDGEKDEVLNLTAEGNCKWFRTLDAAKTAAEKELTGDTTGWGSRWLSVKQAFLDAGVKGDEP